MGEKITMLNSGGTMGRKKSEKEKDLTKKEDANWGDSNKKRNGTETL